MKFTYEVMDRLQFRRLFLDQPDLRLYAVIDGARAPEGYQTVGALIYTLEDNPTAYPLFLHSGNHELLELSPWLVEVTPESRLFDWLIENAGNHPYILFWSKAEIARLKPFFVNLLHAQSPQGATLFFRYYDPAVFSVFIEYSSDDATFSRLGDVSAIATYADKEPGQPQWRVRWFEQYKNLVSEPTTVTFSEQEWLALSGIRRRTSLTQMANMLRKNYHDHLVDTDQHELQQFVDSSVLLGEQLGFTTRNEFEQWLDLSLYFGERFVDDPRYSWAQRITQNSQLRPTEKLQQLNLYLDLYQARSAS